MQKFARHLQDSAGNLVTAAATVTVRKVSDSSLASLFSDEGVSAKANPFVTSTGLIEFYCQGADLNVEVTSALGDVTLSDTRLRDIEQAITGESLLKVGKNSMGRLGSVVDATADLTAITGMVADQQVEVLGYTTAGDGGGGTFYWSAASSATANGGTVFAADAGGTGRWLRNFSGAVNAKWFGAKGDGTTDDAAAIQAAADYIKATMLRGQLYFPSGVYRINTQLNIYGFGVAGGIKFTGDGSRSSTLRSFLSSGTMLYLGSGTGLPQYGVSFSDLGFDSDASSAETNLLRMDYCLDGRVNNCLFNGGKDTQLYIGRAQNVRIYGTEFRGDSANTQYGAVISVSANTEAGQGSKIVGCTVRGMRGTTNGVGIWCKSDGGSEHSIFSSMIEGNKIGVLVEQQRHTIFDCSFENAVDTDTQVQIGTSGGTRVQHPSIINNTFSASSVADFKCLDLVNYNDAKITGNKFFNTSGTNVYFGADENNSPSYLVGNELPMTAVSFGNTDGKVIVRDNAVNGTNNPRTTLADAVTTPNVANYDVIATANTGATTITNFTNGYPGKIIMVSIEDANTSIGSGARIDTLTAGTLTPANGDVLFFQAYVGSGSTDALTWKQIGGTYASPTQAAAAGTFTVKSASANAGNTTGWYKVAPGIFVPYSTNPAP